MTSSQHPLVSVVIPCHNQARFLTDAIDSALRQTFPAVEVIVVDDGSTDDTVAVVRKYAAARLIEQRHQGAAAARRAGLRESRGEYLIFLDADDRLLPDAVGTGMESLAAHQEWAFVAGHVRLVHEDGSPAGVPPQEHGDGDRYVELLRSNYIWTPGAVMYRRSVFDSVHPFDPSAGGSADYELNIRIARRFAIGCHHQIILEYRQHGANMSTDIAYMLKSAVSVRRSQRTYVRRDPAAKQAWMAGIRIVQADFGGRLIEQVKTDLRLPGRPRRALRGVLCLLRYYPAGVLRMMSRRRLRRLVAKDCQSR
jgi:glycosyltransferase involved in cell wall biosynthesis